MYIYATMETSTLGASLFTNSLPFIPFLSLIASRFEKINIISISKRTSFFCQ